MLESARLDYRPTMINLTHVINIVAKELMGTINAVSRVREALGDNASSAKKSTTAAPASAPAAAGTPVTAVAGVDSTSVTATGGGSQGAGEGTGRESKGVSDGAEVVPATQVGRKRCQGNDVFDFCYTVNF